MVVKILSDLRKRVENCTSVDEALEYIDESIDKAPKFTPLSVAYPKEHFYDDGFVDPSDPVLVLTKNGDYVVTRYWGNRKSKEDEKKAGKLPKYLDWVDARLWDEDIDSWMPLPVKK